MGVPRHGHSYLNIDTRSVIDEQRRFQSPEQISEENKKKIRAQQERDFWKENEKQAYKTED